jgi:hypothetical protein
MTEKSAYYPEPPLIDGLIDYTETPDGRNLTGIIRTQEIPDDFIAFNNAVKNDTAEGRIGDWMPVASIPVEVAQWMLHHLGYDVTREPFRKTVAMLKQHGLDDFVLTRRSL